jgi:type I restriction enzyme R subunit
MVISVDMLDTGIDVPEVVNLVLFKLIRSKTKFWQILGRGIRLCPDLSGPGNDKSEFYIFDYCQNFEYFSAEITETYSSAPMTLAERLFQLKLELIQSIDAKNIQEPLNPLESHFEPNEAPEPNEKQIRH